MTFFYCFFWYICYVQKQEELAQQLSAPGKATVQEGTLRALKTAVAASREQLNGVRAQVQDDVDALSKMLRVLVKKYPEVLALVGPFFSLCFMLDCRLGSSCFVCHCPESSPLRLLDRWRCCCTMIECLSQSEDIREKYRLEQAERRKLFNLVQELRGNIRVACRVRPIGVSGINEVEAWFVDTASKHQQQHSCVCRVKKAPPTTSLFVCQQQHLEGVARFSVSLCCFSLSFSGLS